LTGDGGAGLPDYLLWEFRDADRAPYQFIANGLSSGKVIPFFGAAASAI